MAQDRIVLRGKLSPPRTDGAIERPRLRTAAACPPRRVTLLTAGPGMGKSWLAGALLRAAPGGGAWVSFEPVDADARGAWGYIVASLTPFLGDSAEEVRSLLSRSFDAEGYGLLAAALSNTLAVVPDTVLVLDDVHVLFGSLAWATVLAWVREAPPTLRFVITSRREPSDYLGDLALHGELVHIDHEGFRLTPEEAWSVLDAIDGLVLSDAERERLVAEADGWIGALQMLGAAERLVPGSARDRRPSATAYLWQFLAREIVDGLGPTEQDLLVVAAALPTCETPILERSFPGQPVPVLLEGLQRRIPFLGRLHGDDEVRRIHPLLRAFLQDRFNASPRRWTPMLRLALQAYEEEGQHAAALEVALLLADEREILPLARKVSATALGPHYLLRVPRSMVTKEPELALQRAFVHYARNEIDECRALVSEFPAGASDELAQTMRLLQSLLPAPGPRAERTFIPRFSPSPASPISRLEVANGTRIILLLRRAMELNGRRRPGPALRAIEELKTVSGWDSTAFMTFFTLTSEAQIREECGELEVCLRLYDAVLRALEASSELGHLASHIHLGRAGIFLKRFLLDEAAACLERGRPLTAGQPDTIDAGFLINEVELHLCRGEMAAGIAKLLPLCAVERFHMGSAHYLFDLDRLGGADEATRHRYRELCRRQGLADLTSEELMLFVRLTPADPRADELLDEALARMRADRYVARLVDALLLKASRVPEPGPERLNTLREAVHYAVPEGFIAPFVLEAAIPDELIRAALEDSTRSWGSRDRDFLQRALALRAERGRAAAAVFHSAPDDGGLSARELEVLVELARGKSNGQIAEALFVSLPTVKTHVASILAKLGAARRTEAVEKARQKGLLA